MVDLVDPGALQRFKESLLATVAPHGQINADGESDADAPAGVRLLHRTLTAAVFGVSSPEQLADLSSRELLLRWLRSARVAVAAEPQREVLGVVAEGAHAAHVVFRESRRPTDGPEGGRGVPAVARTVRVLTVTRERQGWATQLNGGLVYDDDGASGIGFHTSGDGPTPSRPAGA